MAQPDMYRDALFRLYGSMIDRASEVQPPREHSHGLWHKISQRCLICHEGYYRNAGRQEAFDTAAYMVRAALTVAAGGGA